MSDKNMAKQVYVIESELSEWNPCDVPFRTLEGATDRIDQWRVTNPNRKYRIAIYERKEIAQ